jgi:hypothetical protein
MSVVIARLRQNYRDGQTHLANMTCGQNNIDPAIWSTDVWLTQCLLDISLGQHLKLSRNQTYK